MNILGAIRSWWKALVHSSDLAGEVEAELQFHIDSRAQHLVDQGLSPKEAGRQARVELGQPSTQKEKYIETIGLRPLHEIVGDLRFGLRSLYRNPSISIVAIVSLALGIGATVTVFSVIYDAMLHPYPYPAPERICQIRVVSPGLSDQFGYLHHLSGGQLQELRKVTGIEDVIGIQTANVVITGADVPESVDVTRATGNSFQFLGIPPFLGRMIEPIDAPEGQDPQSVAVITYKFWQRHYSGDPKVVGKSIQLDHQDYRIIGVIPPRYRWMDQDIFLPLKLVRGDDFGHLVKLKPGVTASAIASQLTPLYRQFQEETPSEFPRQFHLHVTNILEGYAHQLSGTLYLLFGAVVLLLLIGCANVSILLLARGSTRRHELSIRAALGASRYRIVRQLLVESLLLSITGAGLGILLAYAAIDAVVKRLPEASFAPEADFSINIPILLFSVALGFVTGIVFGTWPALRLARSQPNDVMQSGVSRVVGDSHGKRTHATLIAGQIALTLLLLTTAATAITGFNRLMRMPLGFDPHNILALRLTLRPYTYTSLPQRVAYFQQIRQGIADTPGVISASINFFANPPHNGGRMPFEILGKPSSEKPQIGANFIDDQYLKTLRIPVIRGRNWTEAELNHGAFVVIVNQAFARQYFPDDDPIGHSLRFPRLIDPPAGMQAAPGSDGWLQIIGIVGDAVNSGLNEPIEPAIYVPYTLLTPPYVQILVRTQGPALTMLRVIQKQIANVNPDQQISGRTSDLETWIGRQPEWQRGRLVSILFGVFSAIALALAAVGLYSVAGYRIAQRTPEFAVRMAFGAQRGHLLRVALFSSVASVIVGLVAGSLIIAALHKPLAGLIPNAVQNYAVLTSVSLLMLVTIFVATFIPALRAASNDPMKVLRRE